LDTAPAFDRGVPKTADDAAALREFGRRVHAFREERELSQERLAEMAGLHRTYISSIEQGRRNVALVNVRRLARALGVDPADLVGDL
jgi:transcriptional regulator with XRE-family HTH domain